MPTSSTHQPRVRQRQRQRRRGGGREEKRREGRKKGWPESITYKKQLQCHEFRVARESLCKCSRSSLHELCAHCLRPTVQVCTASFSRQDTHSSLSAQALCASFSALIRLQVSLRKCSVQVASSWEHRSQRRGSFAM